MNEESFIAGAFAFLRGLGGSAPNKRNLYGQVRCLIRQHRFEGTVSEAQIGLCECFVSLPNTLDAFQHTAVVAVAQFLGNILQTDALHSQLQNPSVLLAQRGKKLLDQDCADRCFLRRCSVRVFFVFSQVVLP